MFDQILTQLIALVGEDMLNLLAGLAILIVGWLIARIIKTVVYRLLKRTNVDDRLAGAVAEGEEPAQLNIAKWVSTAAFYLVMLFVLVAFFQTVQLPAVAAPLNAMLEQIALAAPQLLGAILILLVAWLVATIAKFVIQRTMRMTKLDERLAAQAEIDAPKVSVSDSLANGVFWLVFLLFLPAVLNALGMRGLVEPVTGVVDAILGAIPNIFAAAISLFIGWLLARIVRQIVVNLLAATNIDKFGERIGVSSESQTEPLSKIIGSVIYILILIPAVIAALNALGVDAISAPAISMLTAVMSGIPMFFGAVLVLLVAYFAGKLISGLVSNLLTGIGFDRITEKLGLRIASDKAKYTLSEVVGYIVLVAVLLLAGIEAADMLGFGFLAEILAIFLAFGGQVLLALLIFAVGLYLANLTRDVIMAAGGNNAGFMAGIARTAILVLVAAMGLQQVGVAGEIVNIAFGVLLGAIGVAAALAFGLGARETASRIVDSWVNKSEGKE
ncbi:MAG: mechanosensitive ion channel [Anaerolineales bacterium]|nr:mechanosensitive ion channel [Anaerolineales bacterium]